MARSFQEVMSVYQQHHFYLMGTICFIFILLGNGYTLISFWSNTFWSTKISSMAMLLFDVALILLFTKMFLEAKKQASKLKLLTKSDIGSEFRSIEGEFKKMATNKKKGVKKKKPIDEGVG